MGAIIHNGSVVMSQRWRDLIGSVHNLIAVGVAHINLQAWWAEQ